MVSILLYCKYLGQGTAVYSTSIVTERWIDAILMDTGETFRLQERSLLPEAQHV